MKKRPLGRIVASCFAGLFFVLSVACFTDSYLWYKRFYRWVDERPIDIPVDMSRAGTYTGKFVQTCEFAHGESLCLLLPPEVVSTTAPTELLAPLRFTWLISDSQGNEVAKGAFAGHAEWNRELFDGAVLLTSFQPFPEGEYSVSLRVTDAAPALAGVEQRLLARYGLCGLELLPAFGSFLIGAAAAIIAAIIMFVVRLIAKRKRKSLLVSQAPT